MKAITGLVDDPCEWQWKTDAFLRLTIAGAGKRPGANLFLPLGWEGVSLDELAQGSFPAGAANLIRERKPFFDWVVPYSDDSQTEQMVLLNGEPVFDGGLDFRGYVGTGRAVNGNSDTATRNAQAHELLVGAMESISEGFALYDADDRLVIFNSNYNFFKDRDLRVMRKGSRFEEIVRAAADHGYYPAAKEQKAPWIDERIRYHNDPKGLFEVQLCDGRWLQIVERKTSSGGTVTVNTDITAKKHHDEAQRQAQKLQALGQLTSGVAHDFSNVLLALECNFEQLKLAVRTGKSPWTHLNACGAAVEIAQGLTQRLLAFARRQPLQPSVVDVNEILRELHSILRSTFDETIAIEIVPAASSCPVLVDPTQLQSALLNLSLNARDAMPDGGILRIDCRSGFLGQDWASRHLDMKPGSYVTISVADNGHGMTREVAERAVEPFFTTKEPGKGSGLGLSMCYGFIKQSGGDIEIESELGRRTVIRIVLPKVETGTDERPGRPRGDPGS